MHANAMTAGPFRGHVSLPGVHLWHADSGGGGVPVMLLHANTGNSDSWELNTQALVSAGYRAIAFDRRGWGRSTAEAATGPQPGTVAEDLHALAEHLGLDRFHLVGIAGGGYVAYDYALWHPERLRSLIVSASGGGISEAEYAREAPRVRLPTFSDLPAQFREVSLGYMATNPRGLERWLEIHEHSRQDGAPAQLLHGEVSFAKLETIRLPALLMPGDNDLTTPPYLVRAQSRHIPGAQFLLVPEAGHSVNWEQPEVFNRAVLDFIGQH